MFPLFSPSVCDGTKHVGRLAASVRAIDAARCLSCRRSFLSSSFCVCARACFSMALLFLVAFVDKGTPSIDSKAAAFSKMATEPFFLVVVLCFRDQNTRSAFLDGRPCAGVGAPICLPRPMPSSSPPSLSAACIFFADAMAPSFFFALLSASNVHSERDAPLFFFRCRLVVPSPLWRSGLRRKKKQGMGWRRKT
ncbi:hypothetical protein [Pandoravirus japonicus]|uniref:Uncharacterized protein n=1 Tax=Pandoravirus japonicus TaxID=2823154 RepID=A0A811BRY5_9VIRU|nr:hypothetical protein [Pandoravirus japonicus]